MCLESCTWVKFRYVKHKIEPDPNLMQILELRPELEPNPNNPNLNFTFDPVRPYGFWVGPTELHSYC